jgi:AcrR family transcriptional regulator
MAAKRADFLKQGEIEAIEAMRRGGEEQSMSDLGLAGRTKTTVSPSSRRRRIRERLLRASLEVAAQAGYGGLTVAAAIESAGVSRGGFYAQFGGIEDCFWQALVGCADSVLGEIERALDAAGGQGAPEAVLGALFTFVREDQRAARALFIESLAGGPRCLAVRDGLCRRTVDLIEAAWAGPAAGEARPGIEVGLLIAGIFRLLTMRLRRREAGMGTMPAELPAWLAAYGSGGGRLARAPGALMEEARPAAIVSASTLPRGRHDLSAAEVATDQRERILAAVARLVHEGSYAALTVSEITATARVSRKAFYSQFRDRQHAASEAHELFFQQGMTATATAFFKEAEWPERVWEAGRTLTCFVADRPDNGYLSFVESHAIGEPVIQQTYDRVTAFTLFMEEGYHYRAQAEELPRICLEAVAALIFEITYREMREHHSVAALAADPGPLVYLILAPFMGPAEAAQFVEQKRRSR